MFANWRCQSKLEVKFKQYVFVPPPVSIDTPAHASTNRIWKVCVCKDVESIEFQTCAYLYLHVFCRV